MVRVYNERVDDAKKKYDKLMLMIIGALNGEHITLSDIRRQAHAIYRDELDMLQAIEEFEKERNSREIEIPYFVTVKR